MSAAFPDTLIQKYSAAFTQIGSISGYPFIRGIREIHS